MARLAGSIDLLLFNPPYVETDEAEYETSTLSMPEKLLYASWAGGKLGMQVTQQVLDMLPRLLAVKGSLLLVAAHCNHPETLIQIFQAQHSANSWRVQVSSLPSDL